MHENREVAFLSHPLGNLGVGLNVRALSVSGWKACDGRTDRQTDRQTELRFPRPR